ncbi:CoA pyrophosphatase [Salibacteraceae bacterium]|jgi:8-oxo-dGTP pyrophosphatase MutT (NUDIX family)|nr:CoA pyrophosphatase [Salibacteraceae bacterium]MDC1204717.1 CoA pyrophosphatase [Salibacteraceae bacterium]
MENLPNLLKREISKGLPAIEAHRVMAPMERVLDQNYDEIVKTAKLSAVLVLLFRSDDQWHTILMERNTYNGHHSGQISFPGGRKEVYDLDLKATALREFEEEMGVKFKSEEIIGELSELYIPPSNFYVKPYLACIDADFKFIPEEKEVSAILPVLIRELLDPANKTIEKVLVSKHNFSIDAPVYKINGKVIWGATAMMISELEFLLKRIDF